MNNVAPIIRHHLAHHSLINCLTNRQLQTLEYNSKLKSLKRGAFFAFRRTDEKIYLILSGNVKIFDRDLNGNSFIKELLSQGHFFGNYYCDSLISKTECAEVTSHQADICSIPFAIIKELLEENHLFSNHFNRMISQRHSILERRYSTFAFMKNTKNRLICLLMEWAQNTGEKKGNTIIIKTDLTHQEIASMVLSTRVTVTNILKELKENNIIECSKGRIALNITGLNGFHFDRHISNYHNNT